MRTIRFMIIFQLLWLILEVTLFSINAQTSITQYDYDGLDFVIEDQPMVDNQVMVKVNVHHPGFVVVYNTDGESITTMISHGYTEELASHSHDHSSSLISKVQHLTNGDQDHTTYVKVMLDSETITNTLYARLFNDTNMNMQFDMEVDEIYNDNSGKEVGELFQITNRHSTTIIVSNQEVNLTNAQVFVDQVIVPGPAWLVIHINDSGSLGPMVGRRYIPLEQGVNSQLYVDINAYVLSKQKENGLPTELAVFAHLHWDNKEYGIFNKSLDTHLFSPAFDDPIIGNESAKPFIITFKEEKTVSGFELPVITYSILILVMNTVYHRKKRK